ncbi:hypothetical protein SAMN04489835_4986 [Mycolicibacterium rutilum]|uniref:Uncharacterized protein n=1 Tax=Mycolicibacterium rutilum TaxID=370526 RepID=A0A1H6LII4_MYCRU|nr:hypothetical protein [Mycolicibacterium rutilum]SEH86042.1 hypothetical protein SAMN04489835_4986 [Mycolicibacterium rutilum]
MTTVDLAPEVLDALRAMADHGDPPPRCRKGVLRAAISGAVRGLADDTLDSAVRPWDLQALRQRAAALGEIVSARAVFVDESVMVAELAPSGERIVFRGVDDGWRLVRFADGADYRVRPETTRLVELPGSDPDAVLAVLGISKPDGVELRYSSADLGQGETETRWTYSWVDAAGRSILVEEIKGEIYDGATPAWRSLRAVIIDGDGGLLLSGRDGTAVITEG